MIKANFASMWTYLQNKTTSFPDAICWWEEMAKPNIKRFYIQQGKENKKMQYGLINYLELKLRKHYEQQMKLA